MMIINLKNNIQHDDEYMFIEIDEIIASSHGITQKNIFTTIEKTWKCIDSGGNEVTNSQENILYRKINNFLARHTENHKQNIHQNSDVLYQFHQKNGYTKASKSYTQNYYATRVRNTPTKTFSQSDVGTILNDILKANTVHLSTVMKNKQAVDDIKNLFETQNTRSGIETAITDILKKYLVIL